MQKNYLMKKLNLQLGSIKEMLTKEQMKKIVGGYDDPCDDECESDADCGEPGILGCFTAPAVDCDNPATVNVCSVL